MPLTHVVASDAIHRLDQFDAVIDARSPSEFAIDRLPGALNWPSLDDAERHSIGTEYKQVSAFAARKRGAVLVTRNIAAHIERELLDKPKSWRPLVYCWRGGQRSAALAWVLGQIGFHVAVLEGGYREYRRAVLVELATIADGVDFRVICGSTGSGKSRLLGALASHGAQVLDLEALAEHRGSVLGLVPGRPQPSQKHFDTRLWLALRGIDKARPVYVESESKKIGDVRVDEALMTRMRAAPCVALELGLDARVELLLDDYAHFVTDVALFCDRLDALRALRGNAVVEAWQQQARAGDVAGAFRSLLVDHYDPMYRRSSHRNFAALAEPALQLAWDGSPAGLDAVARQLIDAG